MRVEKNNATCSICGKSYYMCISCKDQRALSPWKIHTDTSEHYKIYQILHGVSVGVYTNQEAKEKLKNVDLRDKTTFLNNIQKRINDIMSTPVVASIQKEENNVDVKKDVNTEVKNEKPFVKSFKRK